MKKLILFPFAICFMVLVKAQNVSIGHQTPVAKLDIRGLSTSPSIPGILSTGIARFGVAANEGIDIGKMASSPFIAWIQSGYGGTEPDPISFQPLGGNVGIGTGTTDPSAKLHINGTLKVADGTQGAGKILTSDANGLASWQPPPPPPGTNNPSVSICCQRWMTKNLDVANYRNGDPIPKVTDNTAWAALTTGAYCYYNNDSTTYAATYGKLYNWYALNDPRGLAPEGWYFPTDFEWATLSSCLGGDAIAGSPMKELGSAHWFAPNVGATNLSGFTALPGGFRNVTGVFSGFGVFAYWWTSTESSTGQAYDRSVGNGADNLFRSNDSKGFGFSLRCLRD